MSAQYGAPAPGAMQHPRMRLSQALNGIVQPIALGVERHGQIRQALQRILV